LNKQSQAADVEWTSSLGVGQGETSLVHKRTRILHCIRLGWVSWQPLANTLMKVQFP